MPNLMSDTVTCAYCDGVSSSPPPDPWSDALCDVCAALDRCFDCGHPTDNDARTTGGSALCDCCAERWRQCRECDRYTNDGYDTVGGGTVCGGCRDRFDYRQCSSCADWSQDTWHLDNGWDLDAEDRVCSECVDSYEECAAPDCDVNVYSDVTFCSECSPNYPHGAGIQSYCYKPDPVFHGDGPVFLGLELEIHCERDRLDDCVGTAIRRLGSLGYLKHDGSIPVGFEMVTHPMQFEWAMNNFPWHLLDELDGQQRHADDAVGIHVHVSRTGFTSPAHVYRWMKFFYRNEHPVTVLARRTSEFADFHPEMRAGIAAYVKNGITTLGGRYHAINVHPDDTYEVRVFASSLIPQQVQAALGFVAASVEYTRGLTAADVTRRRGWEWAAFVAWLHDRPVYEPLLSELEDLACAS